MRKIGVIGSGAVGEALANGFLKHGYEVMRGSRDAAKLAGWKSSAAGKASLGDFAETAKFGELVVLAVKGSAAEDVVRAAGAENLSGKTVWDTTNPLSSEKAENGVVSLFTDGRSSLMERLQRLAPQANFVKAFSCVGNGVMINPKFSVKPSMFICGSSESAKAETRTLLDVFGWETEDMGGVESARAIEALCVLWCIPGFRKNEWTHAFKVLHA